MTSIRTHSRYLDYCEKWEYFKSPDKPRMAYDKWEVLDKELTRLLPQEKTGDEETRNQVKALRRVLFRD